MGYKISQKLWEKQKNMVYYESKSPLEEYQANDFADALLILTIHGEINLF